MSDQIPFAAVKHDAQLAVDGVGDGYKLSLQQGDDAVLALVEVAEAARTVCLGGGLAVLDEALARFDFEALV